MGLRKLGDSYCRTACVAIRKREAGKLPARAFVQVAPFGRPCVVFLRALFSCPVCLGLCFLDAAFARTGRGRLGDSHAPAVVCKEICFTTRVSSGPRPRLPGSVCVSICEGISGFFLTASWTAVVTTCKAICSVARGLSALWGHAGGTYRFPGFSKDSPEIGSGPGLCLLQ